MSVRRVMGTEVEYGISVPGQPTANPTTLSSQVVNAWAVAEAPTPRRPRWDFEEESPLRDARGFDLSPAQALDHNDLDEDTGMANVILTNGARLYVDHAHPEYSTPEVTNPRDIVLWDKAGEQVMAEAARRAARVPGTPPIQLYKNNTDGKGASYGAHENYLMDRKTPFIDIIRGLIPFFVTRQVFAGAGPGRDRHRGAHAGVPAVLAGGLLRGRGGPRDHAEAPDHQHPRRAARRRRQVPPAARDHRRREPGRAVDLPEGRDDVARAGDDRGPRAVP